MKKKGFTLIELLAVIVILAVIALIATPIILNVIETAKKGGAESSALGYVDAVEKQVALAIVDKNKPNIEDGTYTVKELRDDYKLQIKGEQPTDDSWVTVKNRSVENCELTIDGYVIKCEEKNKVKVTDTITPKPVETKTEFNIGLSTDSNGTLSIDKTPIKEGETANVTITPEPGYFVDSFECSNGYQVTGLTTGETATTAQTVSITNNGNKNDTVCDAKFKTKVVVNQALVYQRGPKSNSFDLSNHGSNTLTVNSNLWWESITTVGYGVIYAYDGDNKLLGGKQTNMIYGGSSYGANYAVNAGPYYGTHNTDSFTLDLSNSSKEALKNCHFVASLSTGTAINLWNENQATSNGRGIEMWVSFVYYK